MPTPTLRRCAGRCPQWGRVSPWGGPAAKSVTPTLRRCAGRCPQWGRVSPWGGPAAKPLARVPPGHESNTHEFDVLIIGSGLAGLTAALRLAPANRVAVVTKRGISDGSSNWAQGGIAAVLAEGDSYASHVDDTLVAGAGLCDLEATRSRSRTRPPPLPGCRNWGCPSRPRTANCT
jgi:hypothetical protein